MTDVPVEEVLGLLNISVANVGSKEISAHCPFHADSHPSFSINIKSGLWICYQCSRAGNLSMLVEGANLGSKVEPRGLMRQLRQQAIPTAGIPRDPMPTSPKPEKPESFNPYAVLAKYESFKDVPPWAIEDKNLTWEVAQTYGLKWDGGWVIPIRAPTGELWGWQFKRVDFVSNYPKQVKKSLTLFGLRELQSKRVALVESPLDVCRLAAVGVAAVAAYGAYVSRVQVRLLVEAADQIVLALDNDKAGWEQTAKLYPRLARLLPTSLAVFPYKDPGDLSDEEAVRAFNDVSGSAARLPG